MKAAMKSGDAGRLEVVRFLVSILQAAVKEKNGADGVLSDADVISILQKEIKKRNEAISLYQQAGREDLVSQERSQVAIIASYVPAPLTSPEIEAIVDQVLSASSSKDFSSLMKAVMPLCAGRADGKLVSEIIRSRIG